jgi:hypothetical protein
VLVALAAIASLIYYGLLSNLSAFRQETAVPGSAFDIVDLPGKGKGIVALREIKVFLY